MLGGGRSKFRGLKEVDGEEVKKRDEVLVVF